MSAPPLWTVDAMAQAMGAERSGVLPAAIDGISIDSRTLVLGEAFFAIQGDARDGHEFVSAALESQVLAAVQPGDAVMVKGSLGSRMGPIVKALERTYARGAGSASPTQG